MDVSCLTHQDIEALKEQQKQPTIQNYGQHNVGVERFPMVSTIAKFMRILGFVWVAGGALIFAIEFLPWLSCIQRELPPAPSFFPMPAEEACPLELWVFGLGGAIFVVGLGIVAVGELLRMFRSIEGNTYDMKVVQEADYKGRLAQGS
jgi:hypothetical protein